MSDQKWWLRRRGGSWKYPSLMLYLPSLISHLPLLVPFMESCPQHSPTDPQLLRGHVSVSVCQDLAGWEQSQAVDP